MSSSVQQKEEEYSRKLAELQEKNTNLENQMSTLKVVSDLLCFKTSLRSGFVFVLFQDILMWCCWESSDSTV